MNSNINDCSVTYYINIDSTLFMQDGRGWRAQAAALGWPRRVGVHQAQLQPRLPGPSRQPNISRILNFKVEIKDLQTIALSDFNVEINLRSMSQALRLPGPSGLQ